MLDFNKIHDAYYNKVLSHLRTILGDHAADYTQEVFIKIYKSLKSLKDENKLSSWIYSITLNTARDALRTIKTTINLVPLDKTEERNEYLTLIDRITDPRELPHEDVIAKKEMSQCYIDFVKKLPPNYYDIYVLSEFDGFSDAEIAEKLSLSIETVKIRLHRSKTKLFNELRENCSCSFDSSGDLMCEPKE